jgi:hypothetical protein
MSKYLNFVGARRDVIYFVRSIGIDRGPRPRTASIANLAVIGAIAIQVEKITAGVRGAGDYPLILANG